MTTTEIKQDLKIIYDRECDRIYRIAMVYLRNVCDAEDAVQAVFVKLLEKPQCFEDEEHEKAWFILVTKITAGYIAVIVEKTDRSGGYTGACIGGCDGKRCTYPYDEASREISGGAVSVLL